MLMVISLSQSLQASPGAGSDDSDQLKSQLAELQAKLEVRAKEVTEHLNVITKLVCLCVFLRSLLFIYCLHARHYIHC